MIGGSSARRSSGRDNNGTDISQEDKTTEVLRQSRNLGGLSIRNEVAKDDPIAAISSSFGISGVPLVILLGLFLSSVPAAPSPAAARGTKAPVEDMCT